MDKTEKIKILFLAANPLDTKYNFRIEEQAREIQEKIQRTTGRDSFELIPLLALRASDLQNALLTYDPHIVHFTGHARNVKGIVLENDLAKAIEVKKEPLADLFKIIKGKARVVVLNAGYAEEQARALGEVIDVAIGISDRISREAAITFASYFYQSLAFGRSVQESFDLARLQLEIENIRGAKSPVLLSRDGVDASKIFLLKELSPD